MLQITNIDKQTEEIIYSIVRKAGGKVINKKSPSELLERSEKIVLKKSKEITNELNLPNNYSDEQIDVINKRWLVI